AGRHNPRPQPVLRRSRNSGGGQGSSPLQPPISRRSGAQVSPSPPRGTWRAWKDRRPGDRREGRMPTGRCMIEILSHSRWPQARMTGALVADVLHTLKSRCAPGTNLLEIDRWAKEMILEAGAQSCYVDYAPSFGSGPFGHYICTGVNDAVLHGLPRDQKLADGDLLSLDLAVVQGGVAADSAISFIVGERQAPEDVAMIETTQRALAAGIAAARPGAKIGDLSHAIGTVLSDAGYQIN